jgi:hypothetical protein
VDVNVRVKGVVVVERMAMVLLGWVVVAVEKMGS